MQPSKYVRETTGVGESPVEVMASCSLACYLVDSFCCILLYILCIFLLILICIFYIFIQVPFDFYIHVSIKNLDFYSNFRHDSDDNHLQYERNKNETEKRKMSCKAAHHKENRRERSKMSWRPLFQTSRERPAGNGELVRALCINSDFPS